MASLINPERTFGGKRLGEYDSAKDAFARLKGSTPPALAGSQKTADWSGLDLNKVETLVKRSTGVPIWDAVQQATQQGKVMVPNSVEDRMLVETEHYKKDSVKEGYGVWTGTAMFYEEAGKAFGDKITYNWEHEGKNYSISINVPRKFRGKVNCALVINHPDFEIVPLGNNKFEFKVADEKNIKLLENLPKESEKWYHYDEETRIPVGEPVEHTANDKTIRRFWRERGAYGGLVARLCSGDWRQYVCASLWPSDGLGVHTIPLADAPKKE